MFEGDHKTRSTLWLWTLAFSVLALAATSCSRQLPNGYLSNMGRNYCDSTTLGQVNVYTVAAQGMPGAVEVVLVPVQVQNGVVVSITVVNQQSLAYKTLQPEVVLYDGQEVVAGYLSTAELNMYDLISISSYTGMNFLQSSPQESAVCGLPLLGAGTGSIQNPLQYGSF